MTEGATLVCTICRMEKPIEHFKEYKHARTIRRRSECIACYTVMRERKTGRTSTLVEQIIAVPAISEITLPNNKEKRLAAAIEIRMTMYKENALEALHDLAVMPITDNSGMMQVKFMAASRLAGPAEGSKGADADTPYSDILKDLNARYHASAVRIREVRERVTTFTDDTQQRQVIEAE